MTKYTVITLLALLVGCGNSTPVIEPVNIDDFEPQSISEIKYMDDEKEISYKTTTMDENCTTKIGFMYFGMEEPSVRPYIVPQPVFNDRTLARATDQYEIKQWIDEIGALFLRLKQLEDPKVDELLKTYGVYVILGDEDWEMLND